MPSSAATKAARSAWFRASSVKRSDMARSSCRWVDSSRRGGAGGRVAEFLACPIAVVNAFAGDIGGADRAIVTDRYQHEQQLFKAFAVGAAEFEQRRRLAIEHADISVVSRLEPAQTMVQIERAGAAERCQIEGLRPSQFVAGQCGDLVGLVQRLKLRQRGAGADIRAKPDPDRSPGIDCVEQPKQA